MKKLLIITSLLLLFPFQSYAEKEHKFQTNYYWNTTTFIRDQKQDLPQLMFSINNISKDSFNMEYQLPNSDIPDHAYVSFRDELKDYKETTVLVMGPNQSKDNNPLRIKLLYITDKNQAIAETKHQLWDK